MKPEDDTQQNKQQALSSLPVYLQETIYQAALNVADTPETARQFAEHLMQPPTET